MPRRPRAQLAGWPQHVIQCGNNRQPTFFAPGDYAAYLAFLGEQGARYGCQVHAHVLMTNHVHLLMTPSTSGAISRCMQQLGRNDVLYVNRSYSRTGTLWEGRFRSCLVGSGTYLLNCYRYIELNPVRAGLAKTPDGYRWSSYGANALGRVDPLVTAHAEYEALGATPEQRQSVYRELVEKRLEKTSVSELRYATQKSGVYGDEGFRKKIETILDSRKGL